MRVELLAGLARTMPQDDQRSRAHASTAVALARRLGDPRALTIALATWVLVTWGPDDTTARLAAIDEVIALADDLAWIDVVDRGAQLARRPRSSNWAETVESEADTAALYDWAASSGRPFFVALAAMRQIGSLLAEGRLDEAEEALSNPPPGAHASPNFSEAAAAQLFLLRLAQGTLGELLAVIESFLDAGQAPFAWRAAHVLALVETGDERAVDALRDVGRGDADSTPQLALADCGCAARRCDASRSVTATAHVRSNARCARTDPTRSSWRTASPRSDPSPAGSTRLRALITRVPDHKEVASAS